MSIERHHLLFERAHWSSQTPQKALRESKGMIVPLDSSFHRPVLHKNIPAIPLVTNHIAMRALGLYYPHPEAGKAIDNMCFAIDEASKNPRVYPLERQLALLAIHGLEIERPYAVQGQALLSNEDVA